MDTELFLNPAGRLVDVEREPPLPSYVAYVPEPLPPAGEDAAIAAVARELGEASLALGQLTGIGEFFPNPDLLVRPYLRREAVASSRIEGTMASFSDVVALEAGIRPAPGSDTQDVFNYVVALDAGLRDGRDGLFSLDLARTLHRQLMTGARGEALSNPGEFRAIQNHIGSTNEIADATYVPPPPSEMYTAMESPHRLRQRAKAADALRSRSSVDALPVRGDPPLPRRQRPGGPPSHRPASGGAS